MFVIQLAIDEYCSEMNPPGFSEYQSKWPVRSGPRTFETRLLQNHIPLV